MVISSLCLITVEEVIRGLRWGIRPKGAEALSSHHIWIMEGQGERENNERLSAVSFS
jgi:hypothetical protein